MSTSTRDIRVLRRVATAKPRRVVLQHPPAVSGVFDAWHRALEAELRRPFRTHPIVRLGADGIEWGANPEPGDEIGYGMHAFLTDDCLRAAIATVTQIGIEQVPDLNLQVRVLQDEDPDEISRTSWERIGRWAHKQGLEVMYWPLEELPVPRRRWIGVIQSSATGRFSLDLSGNLVESKHFQDHCLVMDHDRLHFDPACSVEPAPGMRVAGYSDYGPESISYGLSFDKEE